jgi:hypothetical protein
MHTLLNFAACLPARWSASLARYSRVAARARAKSWVRVKPGSSRESCPRPAARRRGRGAGGGAPTAGAATGAAAGGGGGGGGAAAASSSGSAAAAPPPPASSTALQCSLGLGGSVSGREAVAAAGREGEAAPLAAGKGAGAVGKAAGGGSGEGDPELAPAPAAQAAPAARSAAWARSLSLTSSMQQLARVLVNSSLKATKRSSGDSTRDPCAAFKGPSTPAKPSRGA